VNQVEILTAVGVDTSACTQARVVQLYEVIDSFTRNRTPAPTVVRHLRHMGLSAREVQAVAERLKRGDS